MVAKWTNDTNFWKNMRSFTNTTWMVRIITKSYELHECFWIKRILRLIYKSLRLIANHTMNACEWYKLFRIVFCFFIRRPTAQRSPAASTDIRQPAPGYCRNARIKKIRKKLFSLFFLHYQIITSKKTYFDRYNARVKWIVVKILWKPT